jgi:uncharacterized protein YcnI
VRRTSLPRGARGVLALAVAVFTLAAAPAAFAHAQVSPAVAKSGASQEYTLLLANEKSGGTTISQVEMDVPTGITVFSVEDAPGWSANVETNGSGEEATIRKVTWSGGGTPAGELAVFRFVGVPDSGTHAINVKESYSDGSVAEWTGPEGSDEPAPRIEGVSSFGGGSSTLAIIALVVGGLALLVGLAALLTGRGRSLT